MASNGSGGADDASDSQETGRPWPPADDEQFDPLAHAGVAAGPDAPFIIVPRGGAREVGRSCYQVETQGATYLVDCGLNQGDCGQFPDFRGIEREQIDAVFLTHAHIDHCGGLPVLENQGLLDEDAPIIATQPTAQLTHTMLEDSLKIHEREARKPGRSQMFTGQDVTDVCNRFVPVGYEEFRAEDYADIDENDPTMVQFGGAGHLLGSAWVSLQTVGHSVVFSGDLGGRSSHLPDIAPPPEADVLVMESTYGDRHSHTAFSDAQTNLYNAIERALKSKQPVLIPTFAIGRAQMVLLMLKQRLHTLPGGLDADVRIVLDGLAKEATDLYHLHVDDDEFYDDSIPNVVENSGDHQPFYPDNLVIPDTDAHRQRVLDEFDPATGSDIPIIIAPSGMLTGGNSPRYLAEFAARYDDATVILTGYQAVGTPGRALQSAAAASGENPVLSLDIGPITPAGDWPSETPRVGWRRDEESGEPLPTITVPTDWVRTIDGLSAHAAQPRLLQFARDVGPDTIGLVHGPQYAQERLQTHLSENVTGVEQVTRLAPLSPLVVRAEGANEMRTKTVEPEESDVSTIDEQFDYLRDITTTLSAAVADERNNGLNENEVRAVVRDELSSLLADAGIDVDVPDGE